MKRWGFVIIILVCILFATLFVNASSDEKIVENLICNRTDTLSYYYAGLMSKEDTMAKISEITTDFLKEEDLTNLEKYFQCDLEQVRAYEIREVEVNYSDDEVICAEVIIDWEAEGLKGRDNFTHKYSVICKKEENLYKLAQFF